MSILRIRTLGDPVLRTPAAEVTAFDAALHALVRDMLETMYAVGGVGLAAPQVGVGLRVFTWGVDGDEGHVVNPRLETGDEPQSGSEGCLSVPGLGFETPRRSTAVLTGVDMFGAPVHREATGLLARCFQHETDHLHATVYVDRLEGEARREAMRALRSASYRDTVSRTARERDAQRGTPAPGARTGSSFTTAAPEGPAGGAPRPGGAPAPGSAFGPGKERAR